MIQRIQMNSRKGTEPQSPKLNAFPSLSQLWNVSCRQLFSKWGYWKYFLFL